MKTIINAKKSGKLLNLQEIDKFNVVVLMGELCLRNYFL